MKKWILVLLYCFSFGTSLYAQIYERNQDESVEDFIKGILPEGIELSHEVIEWDWGNVALGKKISFFYKNEIDVIGVALQPVCGNNYVKIDLGSVAVGAYPQACKIHSVFFEDLQLDSNKELFVLVEGAERVSVEVENGQIISGCCETVFDTYIFRQLKDEFGYQMAFEQIYDTDFQGLNLRGLNNVLAIQQALQEFKCHLAETEVGGIDSVD